MATWKIYKGEDASFGGVVQLNSTNYDITAATLGFDLGTTLGAWIIRTNSLFGSLGTNQIVNGNFMQGTSGWGETGGSCTLYTENNVITVPQGSALSVTINDLLSPGSTATFQGSSVLWDVGTYFVSIYAKAKTANAVFEKLFV